MDSPYPLDIEKLTTQILEYSYKESNPIFNGDRSKSQTSEIFSGANLVVDWEKTTDQNNLVQVVFGLTQAWDNNHYFIFIYDWSNERLLVHAKQSLTAIPPVWDRAFSIGPDYNDYVFLQKGILEMCKHFGLGRFDIDEDPKGKSLHFVTQSPEEVSRLVKAGEPYKILSLKAEAALEKLEKVSTCTNH